MLVKCNSSLPIFLKTNWSAAGMGFIIIQPARYKVSIEVLRNLKKTGDNKFNFSLEGPRLRHILLGSRKCTEIESHYHSFVSDVTTSR